MIRATCFLSGRVQGVGMRFACHHLAQRFPITGIVENLPDGRVRLVIEGEREPIAEYLEALRHVAPGHLHTMESFESAPSSEFTNFSIRRGEVY